MDYKELIERLKRRESDMYINHPMTAQTCREAATAITDLLARAEAAEARAEKAEMERDAYKEMIYKERPCFFCTEYTGEWNPECIKCDRSTKEYRPKFRLREQKEE